MTMSELPATEGQAPGVGDAGCSLRGADTPPPRSSDMVGDKHTVSEGVEEEGIEEGRKQRRCCVTPSPASLPGR